MKLVKLKVTGQHLDKIGNYKLIRDSKNYIKLDFSFLTKDWNNTIKTVVFKTSDGKTGSKILTDNSVKVPAVCAASESFTVSVFGVNHEADKRITTNPVEIILGASGYAEAGEFNKPLPSVYEQILEKLENIGEIDPEAVDKAVREYLENNPIQGISGKDGFSPIVDVAEIEGGHRITITDADGTKSFDVLNGSDGENGKDGNDYVLTDADKTEIAGIVKQLQFTGYVVDDASVSLHSFNGDLTITIEAPIPENAKVQRVDIPDVVSGTDEMLALEDMINVDADNGFFPYYIMYPKNMTGMFSRVVAIVVFTGESGNRFYDAVIAYLFSGKTIKVYCETDENLNALETAEGGSY